MLLISQDHDYAVEFSPTDMLQIVEVIGPNEIRMGYDVFIQGDDHLLGTFDDLQEALDECKAIRACTAPEHYVSGYCAYDGEVDWNALVSEHDT